MRSHMWQPWDTTSVNIATGEDNVSKLNAGTKASIKLWPNEARIQFRLKVSLTRVLIFFLMST